MISGARRAPLEGSFHDSHVRFAVAFFLPALALARAPSDAGIAHIAYTAGAIDVKAAEAAMTKATDAERKEFAAEMVCGHKAVNEKALALVKALHVAGCRPVRRIMSSVSRT